MDACLKDVVDGMVNYQKCDKLASFVREIQVRSFMIYIILVRISNKKNIRYRLYMIFKITSKDMSACLMMKRMKTLLYANQEQVNLIRVLDFSFYKILSILIMAIMCCCTSFKPGFTSVSVSKINKKIHCKRT